MARSVVNVELQKCKGVIFLKLFFKRATCTVALCTLFTFVFATVAFAADGFIYYEGGLKEPVMLIEERMSGNILGDCIDEWNDTDTPN